jgi:hypothetical protein
MRVLILVGISLAAFAVEPVAGQFPETPSIGVMLDDVGIDLGSPVSKTYFDRRPFAFSGKINKINVALK